jgi:hypothetical protein
VKESTGKANVRSRGLSITPSASLIIVPLAAVFAAQGVPQV